MRRRRIGASQGPDAAAVRRDLVVVGASAGGVEALQDLMRELPPDLRAAVLVVLHTPPNAPANAAEVLGRAGPLPAIYPLDGAELTQGCVMVAPPGQHLVVDGSRVRLVQGPRENGVRPAVDPLFRSAAQSYGPRVIGVVLSGALDDGTEGLLAIHHAGGATLVQDPAEAMFSSMPLSALRHVAVDHAGSVSEIAKWIVRLSETGNEERARAAPLQAADEPADAEMLQGTTPTQPAAFMCPDCGGALADASYEGVVRFQCHVGHAYSAESLVAHHTEALGRAMWTALRTLEEAAALRREMAGRMLQRGLEGLESAYLRQAEELDRRAELIRGVVSDDAATPDEEWRSHARKAADEASWSKTRFPDPSTRG